MAKITVEITDEKDLARIDALRGNLSPKDFVQKALEAGIAFAEQQQNAMIKFSTAKPEFKTVEVATITAALKAQDPKKPVVIEVGRLVGEYTAQLRAHAKKNGNRLPKQLKVQTNIAIERIAFQITADAISKAVKAVNKKAAGK